MSLKLLGKGSILDAIGGAAQTAANAGIAGVKDVGDLADEGFNTITGNTGGVNNAQAAIKRNDSNLSENVGTDLGGLIDDVGTDLGGLSDDVGVTQAARAFIAPGLGLGTDIGNSIAGTNDTPQEATANSPFLNSLSNFATDNGKQKITTPRALAENTALTGVNIATLGKGKALEEGVEGTVNRTLGDNVLSRAVARVAGSSTAGAAYGAGQGTANAIGTAQNFKQAASDVIKPTVQNAAIAGVVGGVTKLPSVVAATGDDLKRLNASEAGALNNDSVEAPNADDNGMAHIGEPNGSDLETATDAAEHLDQSINDPEVDWNHVEGANKELNTTVNQVAQGLKNEDVASRPMPTDLYDQIKGVGGIGSSDYEDIPNHLKRNDGASMDKVAQQLGYGDDTSLHEAIQREEDVRHAPKKPLKTAAEYKELAKQYIAQHAANPASQSDMAFRDVLKRAQAEKDVNDYFKSNKTSGYDKVKGQLLKGAPPKQFREGLYNKTHSPEIRARNEVGAQLKDVRNTLKGVGKLRDTAQKEFNQLTSRKSTASSDDIRAKGAELRSHNTRYNHLYGMERDAAARYRQAAEDLDNKYPDTDLVTPKRGIRLVSNGQQVETSMPAERVNGKVVIKSKPSAAEVESLNKTAPATDENGLTSYQSMKAEQMGMSPADYLKHEASETAKQETEREANMAAEAKEQGVSLEQYKADREAQIAKEWTPQALEDASKVQDPDETPARNAEGDRAILEGIKNGDSDAAILQQYMDATGEDLDQAKKAYGIMEDDPNVDKAGDVENNPKFGQLADYEIDKDAPKRGVRIRTVNNRAQYLVNKTLLRGTAPGDQLAYKYMDAQHLWKKLSPEDRDLTDQLRNHSISELADKADDRHAFQAYALRAKDIEDHIHEARRISDRTDITPYRQNYGASFSLARPDGTVLSDRQALQNDPHALARHYSTYQELENITGLKRATANFHEDLGNDVGRAQHSIANHSIAEGLNQAFGEGSANYGEKSATATTQLKDFKDVYTTPEIAKKINARAQYEYGDDKIGSTLQALDKTNSAMKNIKLSVGGFHNINEMLNQMALNPTGAGAASRALVDSNYFRSRMNEWDQNGTMEKALHSGLTIGAGDEFKSGLNKIPVVHQAHEALFGRQIPFSKMQVFDRYTKNLDLANPDDYVKMRGVARGINNTFGGINRLVDGISASRVKNLSRAVLAEDYNEGQIRTLLTALDPTKIGTTEGRMARQVVAGRAGILALPGTIQAIATGKIGNNPKDISKFVANQLLNPTVQTGYKTKGGIPKQISLVAGIVNKTDRAIAPAFNKENPDKTSGLNQELSGNLSPVASLVKEEKANSDYYGNPMHGKGLNAAEDVGQAVNAAAPIPFTPAARAAESIPGLKNSKAIKIISGGQSPISVGEAAIDTSGIGRVASNPNAPEMKILNSRELLSESLGSTADPNYEINRWNSLRQNAPGSRVYNVLKKQDQVAQQNGEPGDPLLQLSSKNYKTITEYEFLKHADEGTYANNTAAVMYSENKNMIDKYEASEATYEGQMNKLYTQTSGTKGDSSPVESVGGAPQYTESAQQTTLANKYYAMNDSNSTSAQREQFLTNNPELNQLFNAQFNAENVIRKQQGEPLMKPYPEPSSELNNFMNQYTAASKSDRSTLRKANTNLYNQMSTYMGQVDQYELAKTLGQTQLQGSNVTSKQLGEEYDLGQYDIASMPGADDTTAYTFNPQQAYDQSSGYNPATGTYSGSSSDSGAENLVQELENDDKARDIKETVKEANHQAKIKIRKLRKPYFKKITVAKAKGPKVSLKSKSVAIK
jgi:hypothetical protein